MPNQKNQERVSFIYDRFTAMSEHKSRYSKFWPDYEKLWKRYRDDNTGEDAWQANTVDANVRATIDTALSAIVATSPYPNFIAQQERDRPKQAIVDQLYKFNFWKGNQELENYYIYLDALKLGQGFGKVIYLRDEREVQFPEKVNQETLEITYKKKTIYDYDDIKTVRVSPYRMYLDEFATSAENARDVIEEEILDIDEFHRKYDDKYPEAKNVVSAGATRDSITSSAGGFSPNPTGGSTESGSLFSLPESLDNDQVQVLHYVSKVDDSYEIVANNKYLTTKDSPIPYQHKQIWYFNIPYSPDSGDEFWGPGVIALIHRDVDELRKIRNMRINRAKLKIYAPGLYSGLLEEFSEQLVELKPMTWIPVNDPKNFSRIDVGEIGVEAYKEDDLIGEDIRKVTGIDERVLGISPEARTLTATEVRFLREAGLRRLSRFLFLVRKVGLEREGRLKLAMFKQYYEPVRILKIVENAANVFGETIQLKLQQSKEVFTGDFDVRIDPSSFTPKSMAEEQIKWATALQVIMPLAQSGRYDINTAVDKYLGSLEIDPDTIRPIQLEGDIRIAREENSLFVDGRDVPDTPPQFITPAHTREHMILLRKEVDLPKAIKEAVASHIEVELRQVTATQPQPVETQPTQELAEGAARIPSIINQTGTPEIGETFFGNVQGKPQKPVA